MATAEVEEMEVFFDRINRIYKIRIVEFKEPLDVGDFDGWAAAAEIRLDPDLLGFASCDHSIRPAQKITLNRRNKFLLQWTLLRKIYGAQASMRHPDKSLASP